MPLDIEINTSLSYNYKALIGYNMVYSFMGVARKNLIYIYSQGLLFKYISESLLNGAHTIAIISVDDFLNQSLNLSGNVTINTYLRPAKNLTHVLNGDNSISLTWTLSPDDADGDFAFYNVYSNSGSGSIDFSSTIAQLAAGVITYNTGVLINGAWKWAIRVEKSDGKIEQNVDIQIGQKIPDEPPSIGLPASDEQNTFMTVIAVSGGKAFIEFPYLGVCDHFNIYWNTVSENLSDFNFVTPNDNFNIQEGIFQSHTTIQILSIDKKEAYILVRPVNASSVEQANVDVITVVLDGKNPDKGNNLSVVAVAEDSDMEVNK